MALGQVCCGGLRLPRLDLDERQASLAPSSLVFVLYSATVCPCLSLTPSCGPATRALEGYRAAGAAWGRSTTSVPGRDCWMAPSTAWDGPGKLEGVCRGGSTVFSAPRMKTTYSLFMLSASNIFLSFLQDVDQLGPAVPLAGPPPDLALDAPAAQSGGGAAAAGAAEAQGAQGVCGPLRGSAAGGVGVQQGGWVGDETGELDAGGRKLAGMAPGHVVASRQGASWHGGQLLLHCTKTRPFKSGSASKYRWLSSIGCRRWRGCWTRTLCTCLLPTKRLASHPTSSCWTGGHTQLVRLCRRAPYVYSLHAPCGNR